MILGSQPPRIPIQLHIDPLLTLASTSTYPISQPQASIKHVLKDKFDNYEKGPNFREALGEVRM